MRLRDIYLTIWSIVSLIVLIGVFQINQKVIQEYPYVDFYFSFLINLSIILTIFFPFVFMYIVEKNYD